MGIYVKNLFFSYFNSKRKVLNNINLTINDGEFVVILGPSGSGKTTLAYCLSGIIPHLIDGEMSGSVVIDNMDTKKCDFKDIVKRVGVVLQNPEAQIFGMTVREDIAFGLENIGLDSSDIDDKINLMLNIFGLKRYENFNPRLLSGGQKQRLVLASVLAMNPHIIILDEPFSNLDLNGKNRVLEILLNLRREEDTTIILIDRKIPEVYNEIDRIIVLNNGKILFNDSVRRFFDRMDDMVSIGIYPPPFLVFINSLRKAGFNLDINLLDDFLGDLYEKSNCNKQSMV
ncbi:MAG: ABC transporter ATP-binding protein [Thermoprotei archaeon]|nr:MAG: ABC transporter ATP-binding protein [Thermoprotei archaeon]